MSDATILPDDNGELRCDACGALFTDPDAAWSHACVAEWPREREEFEREEIDSE